MDANTAEVLRVLIGTVGVLGGMFLWFWLLGKAFTNDESTIAASPRPESTWTYETWTDDDLDDLLHDEDDEDWEDERQTLRDRLAATLWENRRQKRFIAHSLLPTPPVPLTDADMEWGINKARELGYAVDDKVEWLGNEYAARLNESEGA